MGMKRNSGSALVIVGIILFIVAALVLGGISMANSPEFKKALSQSPSIRATVSKNENMANMSPEAKAHYDKGQELFKQMQTVTNGPDAIKPIADQTIKEVKLAIDAQPTNPILWGSLGDAYTWPNTLGTDEDGLKAYQKAAELDPNNVVYSNQIGDQLIKMNRNGDAVLQLQKSLRLTDDTGYGHASLARAYTNLRVWDQAKIHYERAIEIFQNENKNGKYDTAILEAQKGLNSLPK